MRLIQIHSESHGINKTSTVIFLLDLNRKSKLMSYPSMYLRVRNNNVLLKFILEHKKPLMNRF